MSAQFEAAFATPIAFLLTTLLAGALVLIIARTALVPETRFTGWVRSLTGRNGRYAFGFLIVLWIIAMAVLAYLNLPANVAGSPAFIGLLAGVFIFMGFIWAVIGE
jgi:hypothetical protein